MGCVRGVLPRSGVEVVEVRVADLVAVTVRRHGPDSISHACFVDEHECVVITLPLSHQAILHKLHKGRGRNTALVRFTML